MAYEAGRISEAIMTAFSFHLSATDGAARTGTITGTVPAAGELQTAGRPVTLQLAR